MGSNSLTIIDDIKLKGLYLRVSEGVERLSAKLRRKISTRLKKNEGYPRFIWVNFGRTVEEGSLKAFADFAEQILDGMLDDNFGNITANTPLNLKHLTPSPLILIINLLEREHSGPNQGISVLPIYKLERL